MRLGLDSLEIDRRRLLAYLGGGALTAFGAGVLAERAFAVEYAHRMRIQQGSERTVTVEWSVLHNGKEVGSGDQSARGPIVSLGNVMPGDEGAILLEIGVPSDAGAPTRVVFDLVWYPEDPDRPGANRENGRNEPERKAGDQTPGTGELASALDVTAWYDTGTFDGVRTVVDGPLLDPEANGSFDDVGSAVSGVALRADGGTCLSPGTSVPVAIGWSLPDDVGNVVQGDSVSFDLRVSPERCQ
jgi:hypothetical protein